MWIPKRCYFSVQKIVFRDTRPFSLENGRNFCTNLFVFAAIQYLAKYIK